MVLLVNRVVEIVSIQAYKVSIVRKGRLADMQEVNRHLLVSNLIRKKDAKKQPTVIHLKILGPKRKMERRKKAHTQLKKVLVNPTQLYYKTVKKRL